MKTHKIAVAVGKKIRAVRIKERFSQEGFADYINLDRSNYGAIERGERNISVTTLSRIAVGFDVEVQDLFPSLDEIKTIFKPKKLT
jgi:transcriptional regulator with XRE-family HTH domain